MSQVVADSQETPIKAKSTTAFIIGAACGANCGPNTDTIHAPDYLQDLYDILHVNPQFQYHPLNFFDKTKFDEIIREAEVAETSDGFLRTQLFSKKLAASVEAALSLDIFPIVLGGDHSCAIGTWRGVTEHFKKPIGMVWVDAHMDSHTHLTSHSGAIHGMPLASLMGYGHEAIVDVWNSKQAIDPAYTTLIGIRSYEPEEKEFLESLGVTIVYCDQDSSEIEAAFKVAVDKASKCEGGFGISLDLDVLDPVSMPQVACYVPDGISWLTLEIMIESISSQQRSKLKAFEVVEFAPNISNFNQRELDLSAHKFPISAYDNGTRLFRLIANLLNK